MANYETTITGSQIVWMRRAMVLFAWYFAVYGGTVGPFDSLADCEATRGDYRATGPTGPSPWTSRCWEARGVEAAK
jgi:hypothetical protein